MFLSNMAIKNRITVGVLVLLISLAGVYSYATLPREASPDVPIPFILITTSYSGVAPEDIESAVTMKIEKKLTGIKGVKEVRSTSAEGLSMVIVEFQPDIRIEDAIQYVRDKVDQAKGDLPNDINLTAPIVTEINISEFPIMVYSISGRPPEVLKEIADDVKDAIEQNVPGVLAVEVLGAPEREIRVEVDPDRLAYYHLTIPEVLALIPGQNVNISAGGLETAGTKFNVRVPAQFASAQDLQDINHLEVGQRDGKKIYLQDIARVVDTFKDRSTITRLDGKSAITLTVQKRIGANILEIAEGVKAVIAEASKRSPQGVTFTSTLDQSDVIKLQVKDLENNIGAALVLVVLVLLVSIGLRGSLVVAMAVPLSMLMSFAILYLLGYTLNMIVLFSLVLSVGMLVDDAIVIVENIYRHMQMGYGRMDAAIKGTAEVAWPVITSTFTTCAAFLPLVFWPGIMGSFLKYLPVTLIVVLLSSLFVALVVSPVVCTIIPGRATHRETRTWFMQAYRRLLRLSVSHRVTTLTLCVLLLISMVILYAKRGQPLEFFPKTDPKNAMIDIRMPQGKNIKQVDELAMMIEAKLAKHYRDPKSATGDLDHVITSIGSAGGGAAVFGGSSGGPNEATLTLMYPDFEDRHRPSAQSIEEIRKELVDVTGAEVKVDRENHGPPTGAAVTVRIIGEDTRQLEALSQRAMELIRPVPGLVNLRSDLELTKPELVFRVDRNRALASGVSTQTIGLFLQTAIFGSKVSTYRQLNDEYDITIRLPEARRVNIEDLFRLRIPNSLGSSVPLGSVGRFEYTGGMGTIHRVSQKRVVTLTGDAEGRPDTVVLADVMKILAPLGRTDLAVADVLDWPAFLRAIKDDKDAAGKRIMELLPPGGSSKALGFSSAKERAAAMDLIENRPGDKLTADEKAAIVAGLNHVLADATFYDAQALGSLALDDEGKTLAAKGSSQLTPEQAARLNRLALEAAWPDLLSKAQKVSLPEGYEIKYAGQNEEMQKAMAFLAKAFVIALILITLILVAQFNTLSIPGIIMTTVLLSLIGVLIGLVTCGLPFGVIMTGLGVISLAGVVVKNGIVLMAYTRQLQEEGMDVVESCVEAGATRLRPVLLTAACTVLGLVPTALGMAFDFHTFEWHWKSEATQMWQNMAVALIFGLTFATILTLVVVPSLYVFLFKAAARLGLGGLHHKPAAAEEEPELAETTGS